MVYNKVAELCPNKTEGEEEGADGKLETRRRYDRSRPKAFPNYISDFVSKDVQAFLKNVSWDCICISIGTTISYPFHVIGIRAMAQFVGRETQYE